MKKILSLLLVLVMLMSLCACGKTAEPAATNAPAVEVPAPNAPAEAPAEEASLGEPVNLIVSLTAAENADYSEGIRAAKEYIETTSNGNITLEVYYNAALFTQEEELTATTMGDCDITVTGPSWVAANSPWANCLSGFLFKNYEHMGAVLNGEIGAAAFEKIAAEQNFLPLSAWYYGARQVSLSKDKEVKTPEDLKGINLRMPNSEAWLFLGNALGANATPMSFSELYLALQTGAVDGQDNPLPTVESAKFYEVQECIIMTSHQVDSVWPVINLDKWNSMTEAQQKIVRDGIELGRQKNDELTLTGEEELIAFFQQEGLNIYYPDVDAFKSHILECYMNDPISDPWDKDMVAQIEALGANY